MKRMTASEARRNWFRLLDEVADGETVVVERHGRRIIIRREGRPRSAQRDLPDYHGILRVPDLAEADAWQWEWSGPESELEPRDGGRE